MQEFFQLFWFSILFDVCRTALYDIIAIRSRIAWWNRPTDTVNRWPGGRVPLVSVIVPSFNELETLETTVNSIREQTYGNFQLILVSDGSTDGTPEEQRRLAARDPRIVAVEQERGGKSAALNLGLNFVKGPLLLQLDSDTYLHPRAIEHMVEYMMSDESMYGCGGRVEVYKPERSWPTRMQAMEFIMSFGVGRIASAAMGTTKVISGSFAMWRTAAIRDVGSWDQPMGEDGDLTLKVRKKRGRLGYCPEAVCENRVKDTWWGLTRQRYRWNRNYIKNRFRKHLDIVDPRTYGWRNFLMFIDSTSYRFIFFCFITAGLVLMLLNDPASVPEHLLLVAGFYTLVSVVQYPLDVWLVSDDVKRHMKLYPLILALHPYRFYQRIVQVGSFIMEGLFWQSYDSAYLPENVKKASVKW